MKKGFTLVEMLAVIVVLSIVLTISIRSISAIRQSQLEKVNKDKISNIAAAAILYAQEHPEIFNDSNIHNCNEYNETGSNSKIKLPGISDYIGYSECKVIDGSILAENNYLDVEIINDEPVIKNNITGYNMLNYNIVLYRNNNRVNSFVLPNESNDAINAENRILARASVPQGGMYSSCTNEEYPVKVLKGNVYSCFKNNDPKPSKNNSNGKITCTNSYSLVLGHEEYCCYNNYIFVDEPSGGTCVNLNSVTTKTPTCPTNYKLSNNQNLCIIKETLTESTCDYNYTKKLINSRYLCAKNADSSILIAPTCSSGILSDDQNYCDKTMTLTKSNCSSNYEKRFVNNLYKCVNKNDSSDQKDPTCTDTTKHLVFHQMYCDI